MNRHIAVALLGLLFSCAALHVCGAMVDAAWAQPWQGQAARGYFEYRVHAAGGFPFWLLGDLALAAANGAGLIRWGYLRAGLNYGREGIHGEVSLPHLSFLGLNMILIPVLMLLYIAMSLGGV